MDQKQAYAVGIDFGTQSGRAVLVELGTAREMAASVWEYPHGVMDRTLPDGQRLGADWALQHPADYLQVLEKTVPEVIRQGGVSPEQVIGLGVDFTACTMLPAKADGRALCLMEEYAHRPHAWVKLWKHHAAQAQANRLNAVAQERGEGFLKRYGGKISSEWMVPKVMQILEEDPEIYGAADTFVEAADWVVWQLTGRLTRNASMAGYKNLWNKREGYPGYGFFRALDSRMEHFVEEKLAGPVLPQGARAGGLCPGMAQRMGLMPGTAVAVANIDAHVTVPAVGITGTGDMLMIMGTSTCHILCGQEEILVPGICGVVEDAVLPGLLGYEAGQSCVGDHFEWFVKNALPEAYAMQAREEGISVHSLLERKAAQLAVGESGLVALDWWNGNRSVLVDVDLTGMILGMTLQTRPEEVYRALIEATAYGTRRIIEAFDEAGVPIERLYAAGGIAQKNALLMQIYADVTGREIHIGQSTQAPAVGSAMFGAVAAGAEAGGYGSIAEAAREMGRTRDTVYRPDANRQVAYDKLYAEYKLLHDYFGQGGSDVMKRLKRLRESALSR